MILQEVVVLQESGVGSETVQQENAAPGIEARNGVEVGVRAR